MKVTIIGGGAYGWGPTLTSDILQMPSLADVHLVLQDIDPTPLPVVEAYVKHAAHTYGVPATVESTTDQRKAIEGADAVVVTISTGGFESMAHDVGVPERYGIKQSVGDSVGPGGIARALRNIPVLVGIARDMEELAPDAWLLNITNPMTTLTRSILRETSIKTVGICHEVYGFLYDVSMLSGVPFPQIKPTLTGVNHFPVITELDLGGQDGMAWVRDVVEGTDTEADDTELDWQSRTKFRSRHQLKFELFRRFGGVLPAAGDRHLAEFAPWVLTEEGDWGGRFGIHLTSMEDREKDRADEIAHVHGMIDGTAPTQTWQSGEMVAPILDSLVTNTRRELPLNIANHGQAADLPLGSVVEGICVVDSSGIRGRDVVSVPPALAELLRRTVAVQELTVEAAVRGDRELALQAMLLDPLAGRGDLATTSAMLDELIAATKPWLPQFA